MTAATRPVSMESERAWSPGSGARRSDQNATPLEALLDPFPFPSPVLGEVRPAELPGTAVLDTASNRPFSVDELRARIRRYNSGLDPDTETFRAALILLAGFDCRQNVELLARRTGFDRAFVSRCARRLIDNGVWAAGRTLADWSPLDPASGTFWNDVAVAEGKMCRRTREDGSFEWAPAGFWNKNFQFVDPDAESRLGNLYLDSMPLRADAEPGSAHAGTGNDAQDPDIRPDPARPANIRVPTPAADAPAPLQNGAPATARPARTDDDEGAPPPDREGIPALHHVFRDAVWIG